MDISTAQVCQVTGRPARSIQHWIKVGVVVPDRNMASHSGVSHLFSEVNLVEFCVVQALRDLGAPLEQIKSLLEYGRRQGLRQRWFDLDRVYQQWVVVSDMQTISVMTSTENLLLSPVAGSYLALNLSQLKEKVAFFLGKHGAINCASSAEGAIV